MKRLDAVVPIYNEQDILPELDARLRSVLSGLGYDWRIIYVDDGSVDGTGSWLAALAIEHPQVSVVHLSRNFGQQLAIAAGLAMADADAVVLLDGDCRIRRRLSPLSSISGKRVTMSFMRSSANEKRAG